MFENLKFLNKIDKTLLLNYPKVWISKIHYVAFYGICLWLFSGILGLVIPITPSNTEDIGMWYFLISIISFVLFCFWIYRYVIFNNEKKFGIQHWFDAYLNFLLTIICVAFYTFAPIPFSITYNQRVANYVSDDELFNDINTLNKLEVYMLNDQNYYHSYYDSSRQVNLFDFRKFESFDANTPWRIKYDTLKYPTLLSAYKQESQFKLSENEYEIKQHIKTYFNIESKYRRFSINEYDIEKTYQKYQKLISISPTEGLYYDYFNNDHYQLERALSNISDAKFNTLFVFDKEFLIFLMYSIFYSTLLVNLFKLTPWRQYLISIIVLILLPIILFIFSQLLPYDTGFRIKQNSYPVLISLSIIVAFIFTIISLFEKQKFKPFYNICSQISFLTFPVFPLLILTLLKELFHLFHGNYSNSYEKAIDLGNLNPQENPYFQSKAYFIEQYTNEYWQAQYDLWLNICLFGGVLIFIIIINPIMHKVLVKQLSLPKAK